MDNSWNMVGLVGWWRRMEKENERQKKQGKKKQEKEASISLDQEEPNLSFVRMFFPDTKDKP